jgi:hypothetical protein
MSEEILWVEITLQKIKRGTYVLVMMYGVFHRKHFKVWYSLFTGVPFTTVETWPGALPSVSGSGARRERPKSATFATNFESSRILLALMSRWYIGGSASVCKYRIPRDDPSAIRSLMGKSRGAFALAANKCSWNLSGQKGSNFFYIYIIMEFCKMTCIMYSWNILLYNLVAWLLNMG